jgi:hypothetical protein
MNHLALTLIFFAAAFLVGYLTRDKGYPGTKYREPKD